ncbi:MAG TPA: DUF2249 domain-containing protein [Lacunisphaera sp.]|nr:DUF2249 domain-containing protein [Lacunisphaera sp.]
MNPLPPLELDVRPLCARNRPPLPAILAALAELEPGQALRLSVPFEPVPLYEFLRTRGFKHESREAEPGLWIVLFSPVAAGG